MLNLVIKMEKGKIYEIVWDNGCFTCSEDKCQKNLVSKSIENEKDKTIESLKMENQELKQRLLENR